MQESKFEYMKTMNEVKSIGAKELANGNKSYIEAEMLSMTVLAYKRLGIDVYIEVNNRKLLQGFIVEAGIPEELSSPVILSVDKLAKIGESGVKSELDQYQIEE